MILDGFGSAIGVKVDLLHGPSNVRLAYETRDEGFHTAKTHLEVCWLTGRHDEPIDVRFSHTLGRALGVVSRWLNPEFRCNVNGRKLTTLD